MLLNIKRFVFFLGMAGVLLASNLSAAELGCKRLTATGNAEYPPYLWRADDGTKSLLGANRLIMDEIARRLEIEIDLQDVGSWARAQEVMRTGKVDLIAGAFYTIPRIQYMDYVYPAFLDTTSVVWRKAGSAMTYGQWPDLKQHKGVTVINNSFGQDFDEYAKAELDLLYVASLKQAFTMVQRGRAEYALYEKNPGLAYAGLLGYSEAFDVLDPPISSEGLYLTVSHQSACNTGVLRGALAKTVQEMIADGFMQQALQQGLADWRQFSAK
ncbi:substrate-binding periplasmic protein [Neptuniibacter halophilus]|uniref:substrate-binding periplasmic protein n=1 Tax=Neptuniibacter halophilus TaxID=651666 RepID=UPI002572ACDB|nr:transporter substrate-binding domain-containing protein [Neptuniibacter halophilus]